MAFVLTALGNAWADDVAVSNIEIPQGSTATLSISLTNTNEYRQQFQFDMELPNGITIVSGSAKLNLARFVNVKDDPASLRFEEQTSSDPNKRIFRFLAKEDDDDLIVGNDGAIMTVQLLAASTLEQGTELTVNLTAIEVTTKNTEAFRPSNKEFKITIGAPRNQVTLDENSETDPEDQSGVDVTVLRTIKANEWSTICLPFAMTGAEVVSAFGTDVKIADFTSWEFEGEPAAATSMKLNFSSLSSNVGLKANYPYMIKVSSKVEQFSVFNTDISVGDVMNKKPFTVGTGRNAKNYFATMLGSYVKTFMYDGDFFVSDNKFWQNEGDNSYIKGYRCSFYFVDSNNTPVVLADNSESRMTMNFVDETTAIDAVNADDDSSDEYYNLQGQRVDTPAKGVFIKGGKKILVK